MRRPGLSPRDAMLLLPSHPAAARVEGRPGPWPAALANWRLSAPAANTPHLVVSTARVQVAVRCRADVVLLDGADRRGVLRRAGYDVTVWRSRPAADGGAVAACGPRPSRTAAPASGRRLEALRGTRITTVAARGPSAPAVLQAAGVDTAQCHLSVAGDPRRRAVFRLHDASRVVHSVVKVTRSPGEQQRAVHEQQVLSSLRDRGVSAVPTPLGHGNVGPMTWSAESAAAGTPLAEWLDRRPAAAASTLTRLADWLGGLGVTTRSRATWTTGASGLLPLRGPAEQERSLLSELDGVPGVLAHGDLASGLNVLVSTAGLSTVIDWETARWGAPPLLDLLPLLCLGLARARGARGPAQEAAVAVRLGRGDHPDSPLLHHVVRGYAARLALPPGSLGPLALLAWAYQASMRAVHDELLVAAGLPVPQWVSAAELVLPLWRADAALGPRWNPGA